MTALSKSGPERLAAPASRTSWVTDEIRELILSGQMPPGQPLLNAELALRFGVSATPIREALQRLAAEGLVDAQPQHRATVSRLDFKELHELYDLRLKLEPEVVRRSVEHADAVFRHELERIYRELVTADVEGPEKHRFDVHTNFHRIVRSRCDSRWALRIVSDLAQHTQRFRMLREHAPEGAAAKQHCRIYEACMSGDAIGAEDWTRQHLAEVLATVERLMVTSSI
jgi:DNA-binding GntR family transcriptional regulator